MIKHYFLNSYSIRNPILNNIFFLGVYPYFLVRTCGNFVSLYKVVNTCLPKFMIFFVL